MPRLLSAWYICSLPAIGTLKSFSPHIKRVGVLIRSACRKAHETLSHGSRPFHGGNSGADGLVHGADEVDDFLMAPIAIDRFLEGRAPSRASPVVHGEDDIALGPAKF